MKPQKTSKKLETINTGKKPKYIENYCETKDLQQKKRKKDSSSS